MSASIGIGLSKFCRRRLRLSWVTTMAATIPGGGTGQFAFSTSNVTTSPLQVVERLAFRLQEPELRRVPRLEKESSIPQTEREEKQLRSELAADLCRSYGSLPPLKLPIAETCERGNILTYLASECAPSENDIVKAVQDISSDPVTGNIAALRKVSTPAYEGIIDFVLKQDAVKGMQFLIELREDLQRVLRWMQTSKKDDPRLVNLKELDSYMLRLFSIWFSPGMVDLKRITFEGTSASVIEFVATKEAVHPMKSLDDLRSRLGPGRRVLGLFHKLLSEEPLVFVHAALTSDIPSSMSHVLELEPEAKPTCATFYSITNAIPGLAGVGLGEHLLKQAVASLQKEYPTLETFVTLSPMPRFRKWVEDKLHQNEENGVFVDESILSRSDLLLLEEAGILGEDKSWKGILTALKGKLDPKQIDVMKPILLRLAARYIVQEKHRGKPLDGVARFHLGNGAMVYRLNHAADLSRKGLQNSFGMMVNYRYNLDSIVENQRKFETSFHISASDDVLKLVYQEGELNPNPTSKM